MRLTKKVFNDLAIFMILLGIIIGFSFPFFSLALGVPADIALTPFFFLSCILAGIILAGLNITLSRRIVGSRVKLLSSKMKQIGTILTAKREGNDIEKCGADSCMIEVDSEDELGESAKSFNNLVSVLSEVLELNTEIQLFSKILTSNLEIDVLAKESLDKLIKNSGAIGGAILIEKSGELNIKASVAIKDPSLLEKNERLIDAMKSSKRQLIEFPDDVSIDGVILDFKPKELLVEPILYKNALLGLLILVCSDSFSSQMLSTLKFFNQELSLAFRNALTHEQMTQFAAIDTLTGLFNRRFGLRRLNEEFTRVLRNGLPLSLLMFDIDHFKIVNDTYGHMAGDKVLANVSKIGLSSIREGDILLRYGGEEFLCILPGAGQEDAIKTAERIRIMVMNSHVKYLNEDIKVTVSIGVISYPQTNIDNTNQFIKLTDEALYEAKNSGRNRVVSN